MQPKLSYQQQQPSNNHLQQSNLSLPRKSLVDKLNSKLRSVSSSTALNSIEP